MAWRENGDGAPPQPPGYGLYEVESFVRDGESVPPLLTESRRWRRLVLFRAGPDSRYLWIESMDESRVKLPPKDDPAS